MLRNAYRCPQSILRIELCRNGCAHLSTGCGATAYAKANSIHIQSKILSKLVGKRISGSKKRYYPSTTVNTSNATRQHNAEIFSHSQITKPTSNTGSKNTTRRMAVLNKLFMKHITDLLATGEASYAVLGRGLQVTRVKISPDFSCINVYWLGSGETLADTLLETDLQRCSGHLRHELSQLMLMSQVPRIKFAREKRIANVGQVEEILRTIDFGCTDETDESKEREVGKQVQPVNLAADMMHREFYGNSRMDELPTDVQEGEIATEKERLPAMRQDVYGLDHQHIMLKLLTKMRKSQKAWEQYSKNENTAGDEKFTAGDSMEEIKQKLAKTKENADQFEKFLTKIHERKNTPERKRHNRAADWRDEQAEEMALEAALKATQNHLVEADDYLYEDDVHGKK